MNIEDIKNDLAQASLEVNRILLELEKKTGLSVAVYGSNKEGARVDLELRVK